MNEKVIITDPPPPEVNVKETEAAVLKDEAQLKPKENTDPLFHIERIGHMSFQAHGHHYSGCKILVFQDMQEQGKLLTAPEQANNYFKHNQNIMCVDWKSDGFTLTLVLTNVLNDEQMEILNTRGNIIENMVKEEQEKKRKAIEEAEARVTSDEKKLRELATQGEHCLKNHGAVSKALRKEKKK